MRGRDGNGRFVEDGAGNVWHGPWWHEFVQKGSRKVWCNPHLVPDHCIPEPFTQFIRKQPSSYKGNSLSKLSRSLASTMATRSGLHNTRCTLTQLPAMYLCACTTLLIKVHDAYRSTIQTPFGNHSDTATYTITLLSGY